MGPQACSAQDDKRNFEVRLSGCAVGLGDEPCPTEQLVEFLFFCLGDEFPCALESGKPALHLGSNVGLTRIVLAQAIGKLLEPVLCALV